MVIPSSTTEDLAQGKLTTAFLEDPARVPRRRRNNLVSEPALGPSSSPAAMANDAIDSVRALLMEFNSSLQLQVSHLSTIIGDVATRVQALESAGPSPSSVQPADDRPLDLGIFKPKSHEFPRFDGSTDPCEWKFKANRFFNCNGTSDEHRLTIASFYLEGEALQWYWHYSNSRSLISWSDFLEALETRFGAVSSLESHGLLSKLKQVGSVAEYQRQFEILSNKVTGVSEEHLLGTFISGLKDELAFEVSSFMPRTLTQAMRLARLQESKILARRPSSNFSSSIPKFAAPPQPRLSPLCCLH